LEKARASLSFGTTITSAGERVSAPVTLNLVMPIAHEFSKTGGQTDETCLYGF